jgi:hypothetical protein
MKQNKKGKKCAVFCFAGFFFLKKFCYEVIVKQKKRKRSANHYFYQPQYGPEVLADVVLSPTGSTRMLSAPSVGRERLVSLQPRQVDRPAQYVQFVLGG